MMDILKFSLPLALVVVVVVVVVAAAKGIMMINDTISPQLDTPMYSKSFHLETQKVTQGNMVHNTNECLLHSVLASLSSLCSLDVITLIIMVMVVVVVVRVVVVAVVVLVVVIVGG